MGRQDPCPGGDTWYFLTLARPAGRIDTTNLESPFSHLALETSDDAIPSPAAPE